MASQINHKLIGLEKVGEVGKVGKVVLLYKKESCFVKYKASQPEQFDVIEEVVLVFTQLRHK